MLKFIIDVFCKDTVIGLSAFEDIRPNRIYKNKYKKLFKARQNNIIRLNNKFIDPIACHL